jgi:hypothetical protein
MPIDVEGKRVLRYDSERHVYEPMSPEGASSSIAAPPSKPE